MVPNKRNLEEKATIQTEGMEVNKQEQKTTKQLAMQKIHSNNIHMNIGHPKEDRMCATKNHLQYIVNAMIEVFDYCYKSIRNIYVEWVF